MALDGSRDKSGESAAPAPLLGLVLAGGLSRRMGRDKGGIPFRGRPLLAHALETVRPFAAAVHVSVRGDQAGHEPYPGLPLIVDMAGFEGPAAGLLAAWEAFPTAALLVLAVDMPRIDAPTLRYLVAGRSPRRAATAYRHPDGTPEPLCAIWEPRLAPDLRRAAASRAAPSLRLLLEAADVAWLEAPDAGRLVSVNTPAALAAAEAQESNSTR